MVRLKLHAVYLILVMPVEGFADQNNTPAKKYLTVTDFGGLDVGIPQAMRRSIDFAANSHGTGAG